MSIRDEINKRVSDIIVEPWNVSKAFVVPTTEDVLLAGGAKTMKVTMLYADLAGSTELAMYDHQLAAKVCKAFLSCATKIIRLRGGQIRSFDGDRVMGVFIDERPNTRAVKAALNINWAMDQVLIPKFTSKYSVFSNRLKLAHGVGVDASTALVVRGGIRSNNDLLWIGRAPNIAAKLSSLREVGYMSYITKDVFNAIANEVKFQCETGEPLWEARTWKKLPESVQAIYRSGRYMAP